MIKMVVIGKCWDPEGSDELRFGWQALQRQLPASAKVVHTHATNFEELWVEATALASKLASTFDANLDGTATGTGMEMSTANDQVLMLAHPHLALAPGCLESLEQTTQLANSEGFVWAYDSKHTAPEHPISYCTWRGLERHAALSANKLPAPLAKDMQRDAPLVSMATMGSLASTTPLKARTQWGVLQAFAHDYSDYRSGERLEVMNMVPASAYKILDVGGGEGGFLQALKKTRSCETHLAEYSAQACEVAQSRVDKVWQGDFFVAPITEKFDCITFLDVLEHTTEPLRWLEKAREYLSAQGTLVASIPNVGHWSVIADLLEGRWDYAPVGIHCITHLRFFTRHGIEALFEQAGFEIDAIEATHVMPPPWWNTAGMAAATGNALNIADNNLSAYAYLVRAKLK